jgi:hypothetical protein
MYSAVDMTLRKQKIFLLAVYALCVALRSPALMIHGRIFAEEGPVYLRYAWIHRSIHALLAPHLGYYSLWPNLCAILAARIFPLSDAAIVLTWCAFLAQLLTAWLIVECETFDTLKRKGLALAVLLLASNLEVWLNTINTQFYFAICGAVILISRESRLRGPRYGALLLGGLTGPVVACLAPLFLVRAFLNKSKEAIFQSALLALCAITQFAVVLSQLSSGTREISFQPKGIAPVFLVRYLAPAFSGKIGETAAMVTILGQPSRYWGNRLTWHLPLGWPFVVLWALIDVALIGLLLWISPSRSSKWLLAMAMWLALFAMYGALGGTYKVSERYAFSSEVLIGLSLVLGITNTANSRLQRRVGSVLLACFLVSGTVEYIYFHRWLRTEIAPDWTAQITAWQSDHSRELFASPNGWPGFTLPSSKSTDGAR